MIVFLIGLIVAAALFLAIFFFLAKWLMVDRQDSGASAASKKEQKKRTAGKADRVDSRRLPYRYADRHIFVHGNDVLTGARFTPMTDEYLSHEELTGKVEQANRVLRSLVKDEPVRFQVRGTYRPVTAEEWAEEAIARCWDPTPNHEKYLRRTADYLTMQETARPETYIIVQIGTVSRSAAGETNAFITGTADEHFDPDEVARWDSLATEVQQKLALMNTTPMTKDDLLWLIRKPLAGHFNPMPVEFAKKKPWGAGEFALVTDFNADNRLNGLTIHHVNDDPGYGPVGEEMDSHTCMLIASEWPKAMTFDRDSAWMRFIANLGAQAEINYRGTLVPAAKFADKVKSIHNDLIDEEKDMKRTGREPDREMQYNIAAAKNLHDDVKDSKIPAVEAQVTLMLSASTADGLNGLVREVTNLCRHHLDITFVRPRRAQWRLFEAMLPGAFPALAGLPRVQLQETEAFGIGLPNAGAEVGDNIKVSRSGEMLGWRGDYVGMAGEVPVHYTAPVGIERNSGGGVAIIGGSGGGKSSLALLKFFQESEAGTRCVVLDPKVDFAQFCLYMSFGEQVNDIDFAKAASAGTLGNPDSPFQPVNQRFWDDTEIIDIVRSADGVFDPWKITNDIAEGEILATTMLEMFVGPKDWDECRNPVKRAMRDARNQYQDSRSDALTADTPVEDVPLPTLYDVVDRVSIRAAETKEDPSADYATKNSLEGAATTLEALLRLPYSRLAFAEHPAGFESLRKRRTVFTLRGMETPKDPDPERWTQPQRMAGTIMYVLTRLMADLLNVNNERNPVTGKMGTRPKAQFIDEAYAVTGTPAGRSAVQTSLAQGRSYGLITFLIDQQAKRLAMIEEDSDDATGNQFHTVFVFKQKTTAEAQRAVPLLGRESNTDAMAAALLPIGQGAGVMETGVCVMRDDDNRVATVSIDLAFSELLRATDTNPTTRSIKQSLPISDNVDDWSFITGTQRDEAVLAASLVEDEDGVEEEEGDGDAVVDSHPDANHEGAALVEETA